MSNQHGEAVVLKPISEVAKYLKNMIPVDIPETYALKPLFKSIASEEEIRSGVIAFRDFMLLFCARLATDGHIYAKAPNKPSGTTDYPFLHNVTNLLVEIGYHGILTDTGKSLLVTELPSCIPTIDEKGKKKSPKIPASGKLDCLRFLTLCGFMFSGIDLDTKTHNSSETQQIEVSYPGNPLLLKGLKALSVSDMELREGRRYWNDHNLLRCDFRLMKADETDVLDYIKDILHPLSEELQRFALELHRSYIEKGFTCVMMVRGDVCFAYSDIRKSKKVLSTQDIYTQRVWALSYSMRHGYCLLVRAKKLDKYKDVVDKFSPSLKEIIGKGYGCDRKLRNERCQGGCQGIRVPFDDSIIKISKEIEIWLDNEIL